MTDFFVSYNGKDRAWAEWIAWQLEAAGYTSVIQAWDFRPGGNFVLDMQQAAEQAGRTIAVLSQNYLEAMYTQPEWAAAFAQDPTGAQKTLLPVRIQECRLKGLLSQIVYIDLVGKAEDEARELLLAGLNKGRAKPRVAPGFPSGGPAATSRSQTQKPAFPLETAWAEENLPPEARAAPPATRSQIGGVHLSQVSGSQITFGNVDASVKAGGHIVGGNMIVAGGAAAAESDSPKAKLLAALADWQQQVEAKIEAHPDLEAEDKAYVKEDFRQKAKDLETELDKGTEAKPPRLAMLLNSISNMAPDIIEVTATTLQNPFKGVGLVLEKINNRIKLERQMKA